MSGEARTSTGWFPGSSPARIERLYRAAAVVGKAVTRSLIPVRRFGNGLLSAHNVRRLKVVETVSLGEKRFVSILHIDGQEFLLGGSASSVLVLAKLDGVAGSEPSANVLPGGKQCAEQRILCGANQMSESIR